MTHSPPQPPALSTTGGLVLPPLDRPPLRVLCVDDNRDAADSLGTLLGMVGFVAEVYHDGRAALAAAARFRPGACVLDVTMPGMDGCDLARALRAADFGPGLLLVAVTALGDPAAFERTREAGFDRHLTKPVHPQLLLDTLFEFERRADPGSGCRGGESVP